MFSLSPPYHDCGTTDVRLYLVMSQCLSRLKIYENIVERLLLLHQQQSTEKYLSRLIFTINASLIIIWVFCELSCDGIIVVFWPKFSEKFSPNHHTLIWIMTVRWPSRAKLNNFHINFTNYLWKWDNSRHKTNFNCVKTDLGNHNFTIY